jgi:hypothetical protein
MGIFLGASRAVRGLIGGEFIIVFNYSIKEERE